MTSYKNLPPHSRVWIYQADREFDPDEIIHLKAKGTEFLQGWNSHGTSLHAAMEVFYNRFIVIFVDESHASASGCSIDSSVHFLKEVEKTFRVSLFDRMNIAYRFADKIHTVKIHDLEKRISDTFGNRMSEVIIFNNLVSTLEEFNSGWEVPLHKSWLNKLIQKQPL